MEGRHSRPQRNRRHSRRAWPPEDDVHHPRPAKRLFTPEIKRMLKDWLIRRRENPYPSRDEKKRLAVETGLTYTQICNWFANWRRKLKNSEREKFKKSWGHLIKHYNSNAKGNVEQFSISSEDSIWEEEEEQQQRERMRRRRGRDGEMHTDEDEVEDEEDVDEYDEDEYTTSETDQERGRSRVEERGQEVGFYTIADAPELYVEAVKMEHSNYFPGESGVNTTAQCYQISSTTQEYDQEQLRNPRSPLQQQQQQYHEHEPQQQSQPPQTFTPNKAKYKQQMMEKYLRDTNELNNTNNHNQNHNNSDQMATLAEPGSGAELSKWLESAAKFTPNKNNYFIEWSRKRNKLEKRQRPKQIRRRSMTLAPPTQQLETPLQHQQQQHIYDTIHHKDELDAAEALANLAFNCRQRMLDGHLFQTPHSINAIPSS